MQLIKFDKVLNDILQNLLIISCFGQKSFNLIFKWLTIKENIMFLWNQIEIE